MMTSTTSWFVCKSCECGFPRKILLTIHEKQHHRHHHHHHHDDRYKEDCSDQLMTIAMETPIENKSSTKIEQDRVPTFEIDAALEFASTSSEISEGSCSSHQGADMDVDADADTDADGMDQPKAEPCINFLDHVTTRLARGKRKVSYSCNFCGKDLNTMPQVKEHIPGHIDYKNFPCNRPACPKSFASLYDQLRHQSRHLKKERRKKISSIKNEIINANSCSSSSSSSSSSSTIGVDDGDPLVTTYLTRYCVCNQIAYGDMVACDRKNCTKKWFHFSCVGLKSKAPRGTWHCPECREVVNSKRKRASTTSSEASNKCRSSPRIKLEPISSS